MGTLRAILAEIIGLFVDDETLVLARVPWCAGVGAAVLLVPLAEAMLLAGGIGIVLVNVLRAARQRCSAVPGG